MTGSLPRVVLADDHEHVRAQVREGLEAGGWRVCGEAPDAPTAVALVAEHDPDAVLLDVHMPGNGIRAAEEISRRHPRTAVVMLTHSVDDEDLFDALRSGAVGYLLKAGDPAALGDALRRAVAGEATLSPTVVSRVVAEFRAPTRRRLRSRSAAAARLSAREWEVMDLLAAGLPTDEVARRLFLSRTTVRVHVSAVLRKLRVPDRESALRLLSEP